MLTPEDRDALGVADLTVVDRAAIPWPAETAEQGLTGGGTWVASLGLLIQLTSGDFERLRAERFVEANHPLLDRAGVRLFSHPARRKLVRLVDGGGAPLTVRSAQTGGATIVDPDDSSVVYCNLEGAPHAVVASARGDVIVLDPSDGELSLELCEALGPAIPVLSDLRSDVAAWCTTCDDTWVVREIADRIAVGSPWHDAVAVAFYDRLREPGAARARAAVRALLAGVEDEETARPRRWALALTAEQRRTLEELTLTEIDALHEALEDLEGTVAPLDDDWRARFIDACHRRDDVEGIVILLEHGGPSSRVADALSMLDDQGKPFALSLVLPTPLRDERMRRIKATTPWAWWTFAFGEG